MIDTIEKQRELSYVDLGLIDYTKAWYIQKEYNRKRIAGEINDTLFLLEHKHTYTLGKNADEGNLISTDEFLEKNGITVHRIDRGGDITYHGPGQIVGYPIIDLNGWQKDSHNYLRTLEQVIINVCRDYGLDAGRDPEYTGVWIEDRKICAIGIKLSRWVTMHGFAFNVNTDLEMFKGIIPCGIADKAVTSLQSELSTELDIQELKEKIVKFFKEEFGY